MTSSAAPFVGWEHVDHGADIGLWVFGASKAAACEQAARALTAVRLEPLICIKG